LENRKPTGKLSSLFAGKSSRKRILFTWLSADYVYPETECFAAAIQDQVIKTRNYEKHYLQVDVSDRHRK
jgi:hypothetical protein